MSFWIENPGSPRRRLLDGMRQEALGLIRPWARRQRSSGVTIADLEKQSAAFHEWRTGKTGTATLHGGTWITKADADRLGIDRVDFPGVRVIGNG